MNDFPLSLMSGLHAFGVIAALGGAILVRALFESTQTGPLAERISAYVDSLERELIFLRSPIAAKTLFYAQCVAAGVGLLLLPFRPLMAVVACGLVPLSRVVLQKQREARTLKLESQVEGWLTSLTRALEAAPSLGEAIEASIYTCDRPMREEVELLDNEIRLGLPIDRALGQWSERVKSRSLSMAIATLLVGRETGGTLGEVLRSAAESLREMERLEGVVRTKTAEGKAQAWVISIVPLPLYLAVKAGDPGYFAPLETTTTGHLLLGIAAVLWIAATLSARKILAVQI